MTVLEFILPALVVILLSLPLIKVFTGKVSVKSAKIRLATHVAGFAGAVCLALYLAAVTNGVYAEETAVITGTIAQGLGFVAASLLIIVVYTWLKIDRTDFGLKFIFDKCLLVELWHLSVWSILHAFISVAPWFLFFVVIERLGEAQLAVSNIIRSVSTIFFVIVNSFAATTGALVSNLIGAGERQYLFPLCRKILKLGYAIGLPLVVLAMVFRRQITGFYTDSSQLINISSIPFAVMLLNY